MKNLIEATTMYKMGHQRFSAKVCINPRVIDSIRPVPEEISEHMDGAKSMITYINGQANYCIDEYEVLVRQWDESLGNSI